jgi:hypothetical protein
VAVSGCARPCLLQPLLMCCNRSSCSLLLACLLAGWLAVAGASNVVPYVAKHGSACNSAAERAHVKERCQVMIPILPATHHPQEQVDLHVYAFQC